MLIHYTMQCYYAAYDVSHSTIRPPSVLLCQEILAVTQNVDVTFSGLQYVLPNEHCFVCLEFLYFANFTQMSHYHNIFQNSVEQIPLT